MRQLRMIAPLSSLKSPRSPNFSSEGGEDSPCAMAKATVERNTSAVNFMKKFCLPLKLFVKALSDFSSSSVFGQSWQLWHNWEPGEPATRQLKIDRLEL